MKDKEKKLMFLILILVIIIVVIIIILLNLKTENNNNLNNSNTINEEILDADLEGKDIDINYEKKISSLITKYDYYNVTYCAEKYQNAIYELLENNNEENQINLFSLLDEEYIKEKNIEKNNIVEKYQKYFKSNLYIDEITTTKITNEINAYIVKGKLINLSNLQKTDYILIVKLDTKNNTFTIYPNEYVIEKKYNTLKEDDVLEIQKVEKIENKTYNTYEDQSNKYNTIAIPYFQKLKNDMQYDIEYLYKILDNEYKQKRFGSFDYFKQYINNNKEKISKMEIKKYAKYYYDGYVQYVCIDSNGDYYIFNETSTMKYTVLLDTYTIDQPKFIEKYEAATDEQKAGMNIDKFMQALNAKDYNYAYNCLANSFKQNNFKTLENFEIYVKNNFYSTNKFEYSTCTKEGGYYVYKVNITDSTGNAETKQKNFIVNLKDERNFEMSFNID